MRLAPREIDKLLLHQAGVVAQKRYARRLPLNYTEAMALIAAQLQEFIRDGDASVSELMNRGKQILGFQDVMPGVAGMIHEVQVEGTFPDGTKLVTVHHPICQENGSEVLALYGSGLTRTGSVRPAVMGESLVPGGVETAPGTLTLNDGRKTCTLTVTNMGDRPIQVGSHYPFIETNPSLKFDRNASYGYRLNIPAGTAVRFEPGESKDVELVLIAGEQLVLGGNSLTDGKLGDANRKDAMTRVKAGEFQNDGSAS